MWFKSKTERKDDSEAVSDGDEAKRQWIEAAASQWQESLDKKLRTHLETLLEALRLQRADIGDAAVESQSTATNDASADVMGATAHSVHPGISSLNASVESIDRNLQSLNEALQQGFANLNERYHDAVRRAALETSAREDYKSKLKEVEAKATAVQHESEELEQKRNQLDRDRKGIESRKAELDDSQSRLAAAEKELQEQRAKIERESAAAKAAQASADAKMEAAAAKVATRESVAELLCPGFLPPDWYAQVQTDALEKKSGALLLLSSLHAYHSSSKLLINSPTEVVETQADRVTREAVTAEFSRESLKQALVSIGVSAYWYYHGRGGTQADTAEEIKKLAALFNRHCDQHDLHYKILVITPNEPARAQLMNCAQGAKVAEVYGWTILDSTNNHPEYKAVVSCH